MSKSTVSNIDSVLRIFFSLAVVAFSVLMLVLLLSEWNNASLRAFVVLHFPATIGIPLAGIIAFMVVHLYETARGRIKLEILSVKFEGAAGPIIMWVFTFFAITASIRMLWPLTTS